MASIKTTTIAVAATAAMIAHATTNPHYIHTALVERANNGPIVVSHGEKQILEIVLEGPLNLDLSGPDEWTLADSAAGILSDIQLGGARVIPPIRKVQSGQPSEVGSLEDFSDILF